VTKFEIFDTIDNVSDIDAFEEHALPSQRQCNIYVLYRVPVTGTRSVRIAHRQSLWFADIWHAYWDEGSEPSRRQHGLKRWIKMASTFKRLLIWRSVFLCCLK